MSFTICKLAAATLVAAAIAVPPMAARAETAPASCQDMKIAIYFAAYESVLSPYAEKVIEEAGAQLKDCAITGISVNVLSEEAHTDEDESNLSEARATSVIKSIGQHGIETDAIKADLSGAEATAASAKPMVTPMARRVSVAFEVQPRVGV